MRNKIIIGIFCTIAVIAIVAHGIKVNSEVRQPDVTLDNVEALGLELGGVVCTTEYIWICVYGTTIPGRHVADIYFE